MNETEYQKGRLEALSLIVRAIVTVGTDAESGSLGATLIHLANRHSLDTPLDTQAADFRMGFQNEVNTIVEIIDAPSAKLSRSGWKSNI